MTQEYLIPITSDTGYREIVSDRGWYLGEADAHHHCVLCLHWCKEPLYKCKKCGVIVCGSHMIQHLCLGRYE